MITVMNLPTCDSDAIDVYKVITLMSINKGKWNKRQRACVRRLVREKKITSVGYDEFEKVFMLINNSKQCIGVLGKGELAQAKVIDKNGEIK